MKKNKFLNSIKSAFFEIRSYFIPKKVMYRIEGSCKKCGKCCHYMYSFDTYSEKEFKLMQYLYPSYRRFKIVGKDEAGNLIFACRLIGSDGLCSVYEDRLNMCKSYPKKKINFNGKMHEGCGFYVVPDKTFEDYCK